MNDKNFDKLVQEVLTSEELPKRSSDLSSRIMQGVLVESLRLQDRKKLRMNMLVIAGVLTAWVVLLTSFWQTALIQDGVAWSITQLHTITIFLGWLKYPIMILLAHGIVIRLIMLISVAFGKRILAIR